MFKKIEQWILDNPIKLKVILGVGVFVFLANLSTLERAVTPVVIKDEIVGAFSIKPVYALEQLDYEEVDKLTKIVQKAPKRAVRGSGANLYDYHSCTWWVKSWKPSVPNNWHNANQWDDHARSAGWAVSNAPVVGAVAQSDAGYYGHVGYVVGVGKGTVTIREGNYDWSGSIRTITVPTSKYVYLY